MAFKKLNKTAVEAGIQSLELKYTPIFSPSSKEVLAYRTSTVVYSLEMGTLTERDYTYAVDFGNETGIRLSEWNIREAIDHINRLTTAGIEFDFIAVKCTASYADTFDIFSRVKSMLNNGGLKDGTKLCLEFPQSTLYLAGENANKNVLDLKNIGVRTMISGVGSNDCPVSKLMDVPVDQVLLEPYTTALVQDRNKPDVLQRFCSYLKSMNLKVYAEGAQNDQELFELRRFDVKGSTVAETYEGSIELTDCDMSIDDILLPNEEVE